MNNKTKKTAGEANRKKKIYQRIISYLQAPTKTAQDYSQTLEEYLNANEINVCFKQLHKWLDRFMIDEQRKNVYLEDGIYIMLQGSITYTWTKNKHDRDRKDHLFSLAKAGNYSNLSSSVNLFGNGTCINQSHQRENMLAHGFSLLINAPFAVLESQCGNICTNQDCIFIKLPQNVLEYTNFYELKSLRTQLLMKAKLPGIKNYTIQNLFTLNYNLHHTLRIRKMTFHNKFSISNVSCGTNSANSYSIGIIMDGSACIRAAFDINSNCIKANDTPVIQNSTNTIMSSTVTNPYSNLHYTHTKKLQLSKYSLLLPNFEYEVSSSQIQVLEITRNPTILFKKPSIIHKFITQTMLSSSSHHTHSHTYTHNHSNSHLHNGGNLNMTHNGTVNVSAPAPHINQNQQKISLLKYRKKIAASISLYKQKMQKKLSKSKQQKWKKKQFSLFSKQCQNYCIVPMQYCKQNLLQIKNAKIIKNNKQKEQAINRKPKILFNYSKKDIFSNNSIHHNNSVCHNNTNDNDNKSGNSNNVYGTIRNSINSSMYNGRQLGQNQFRSSNTYAKHSTNLSLRKTHLMERFQNYAKDIYNQFVKSQKLRKQKQISKIIFNPF